MEIREMDIFQLEKRMAEIEAELNNENADVEKLNADMDAIEARKKEIETEAAKAEEARNEAAAETIVVKSFEERGDNKMTNVEIRNTEAYVNAYANYLKTGDDSECRAMLSENVPSTGQVPVPEFVYEEIKTAWDTEELMSRVRRVSLKGNMKVGFERTAGEATVHTEGAAAVTEEELTMGIVTIIPKSIKKWISISDEVVDLAGEAFVRYIYREIGHKIVKKAADELVAMLAAAPTASTATAVAVPKIEVATPGVGTVAKALGELSDEASNPVIIMNKKTWSVFKDAQYANGYGVDPFEGLDVIFNNTIPAFADADTGEAYMYVGDLDYGAIANMPNGEEVVFKYDDLSLATADLVKIIGRLFVGLGIVAPNAFVAVVADAE